MKRKFVWLVVAGLMVISLVLASCAPAVAPTAPTAPITPAAPTSEAPKYGGVLNDVERVSIRGYAPVLIHKSSTPAINFTNEALWGGDWTKGPAGSNEVGFVVFVGSYQYWGPRLATSFDMPDDQTLIFHIRKGVHFALDPDNEASRLVNGREMTAEDVAASLNLWYFDPEGHWQGRIKPAERPYSITATDKYTVRIDAVPGTLSTVMYNSADFSAIFPPEVYEKYDKMRDWPAIVGTGPFILKNVVEDSVLTYVRNDNYWDVDPIGPGKGNQLPYLDGVKLFIIKDPSTRMAALRTAKLDMLEGEPPSKAGLTWEDAEQMMLTNPELKYLSYLSRAPGGLEVRVDKPELPWYDIKVRQAMVMAIDYDTIIRDYQRGNGGLAYPIVPYPEHLPMYTPMDEQNATVRDMYTYQPDKAKQILAEAGYPDGFKLEVVTEAKFADELTILADYLDDVGIDVDIQVKEHGVFISVTEGWQHNHASYGGLSASTAFAFHSTNPTDPSNVSRVDDPYANQVYQDTRADFVFNEAKLWPMMKEFKQWEIEQAFVVQFPAPLVYHMWWPWVKNYHGEDYLGISTRHYWTKHVWIDQELKKSMGF